MRTLDGTDREIIRLLLADARRPYSDIADRVDLSAPAVSDRIDRLRETGVIEGFTVRIDDEALTGGLETLVTLELAPLDVDDAYDALVDHDGVEHVFLTAEGTVVFSATMDGDGGGDADTGSESAGPAGGVRRLVAETVGLETVRNLSVRVLDRSEWSPTLGNVDLAVDCVVCGNTVTAEGESARVDGTLYHFCCGSCRGGFEDRYERLADGV
ncbi:winged helix-turn-helix transcriptional regulator [Halorubrum vacuolatum]|uniref:Transcriptional regulator, AsnC family n=1 Tax=Halorubrum vacuolatum TaxID=63740 RepID=A0A238VPH9_HALVU|nr:AsnC family transcriptional regulator [Halorubrum vacuolatum]SNR36118.1 transcriptional regulator, AsnC family [Halorubrum vacuolatum]